MIPRLTKGKIIEKIVNDFIKRPRPEPQLLVLLDTSPTEPRNLSNPLLIVLIGLPTILTSERVAFPNFKAPIVTFLKGSINEFIFDFTEITNLETASLTLFNAFLKEIAPFIAA